MPERLSQEQEAIIKQNLFVNMNTLMTLAQGIKLEPNMKSEIKDMQVLQSLLLCLAIAVNT